MKKITIIVSLFFAIAFQKSFAQANGPAIPASKEPKTAFSFLTEQ